MGISTLIFYYIGSPSGLVSVQLVELLTHCCPSHSSVRLPRTPSCSPTEECVLHLPSTPNRSALLTIVLFSSSQIIVLTPNLASLNLLLQACLFMLATTALHELVWSWTTGLPSPRRDLQAWVFAAPYQTVALIRMFLPTWLGGYSRSSDIELNVTAASVRPPFYTRLWWLFIDPHSGVLFAFIAAIGIAIWRATKDYEHGTVDINQTACMFFSPLRFESMDWILTVSFDSNDTSYRCMAIDDLGGFTLRNSRSLVSFSFTFLPCTIRTNLNFFETSVLASYSHPVFSPKDASPSSFATPTRP